MTCRHYVICSTERDRQSRWSVAYTRLRTCVKVKGHHSEHFYRPLLISVVIQPI